MTAYASLAVFGASDLSDQSRTLLRTRGVPLCNKCWFSSTFFCKFGTISGRSVNITSDTLSCQVKAAESPTSPVPDPSSRTRGRPAGTCRERSANLRDRSNEEVHVFRPKLSSVRDGSCRLSVRSLLILNDLVIAGAALRPDLSLNRTLARSHMRSWSSSVSHSREEPMMLVK